MYSMGVSGTFFYSTEQLSSDFVSERLLGVVTARSDLSLIRLLLALDP